MKTFKTETHCHTSEVSPCGHVSAIDIVELYEKANYQSVIITDHYTKGFFDSKSYLSWDRQVEEYIRGYQTAKAYSTSVNILLGMELTFTNSPNDYLVYGFDLNFLYDYPHLYNMTIESFRPLADKHNLIVVQAHPFRFYLTRANPKLLDGIEVHNGNPRHESNNNLAYDHAIKYSLTKTSGSDFHQRQDLARGGIITKEPIINIKDYISIFNADSKTPKLITV